eukprot:CAMPEP_0179262166 /NCGR_PEP_ID=MMETSP0797-20121207/27232_1 /TAXON_ID=47934 /ORGANISM="Dinophysis acuminata, Strain DAEP01" /LENGTH=288 /DNA_ID=CAMNT_0020970303 /DNA_START=11 /DNA_END=873 /DNA_ORIENTATION=-
MRLGRRIACAAPPARWRRRPAQLAVLAAVAAGALPVLVLSPSPVQLSVADDTRSRSAAGILSDMQSAILPLQRRVDSGHIVPRFGDKAYSMIVTLSHRVGASGSHFVSAMDSMLHVLFMQQLLLLRQQLVAKFERAAPPMDAVSKADGEFVRQAQELRRPRSQWSFEHERHVLSAILQSTFRRDADLAEEQELAAQTQQSTVHIISRLQGQMEALQRRLQAMRAGSPWMLSASYRIPRTPVQLVGRYQQGRANLELSLRGDGDPLNAEAGFVEGLGPVNLGVTLNVAA